MSDFIVKEQWGEIHYNKDERALPDIKDPCPKCNGAMVYGGSSYSPYGELYYCPSCNSGWLVTDVYNV